MTDTKRQSKGFLTGFLRRKSVFLVFIFLFAASFLLIDAKEVLAIGNNQPVSVGDVLTNAGKRVVNAVGGTISDGLKPIAEAFLEVEAKLANAAATLFVWMLDPKAFHDIMDAPAVYQIWKIVRDTVNMIFILVLLFSAFATIYQISAYRYDRIIWTVVIMALLVNFSFPIAQTIIDFFNSMMYFFVHSIFGTTGKESAQKLLGSADLATVFLPDSASAHAWSSILLAIIMLGIFTITLLMLSLLMLIRLVALPLLVIFSPIGFAGMAAPLTKSYAKQWWDKLFQYASYGPISVFMVLVGIRIMDSVHADIKTSMQNTANIMSGAQNQDLLASMVWFAIPITLMWMAMTSAESNSKKLGSSATAYGMKMGKWARKAAWGTTKFAATRTPVVKNVTASAQGFVFRAKERWGKSAKNYEELVERKKGSTYAEALDSKKTKEAGDKMDVSNMSAQELIDKTTNGKKYEKAAAIIELAAQGLAKEEHLRSMEASFGENSLVTNQVRSRMKSYDPLAAFTYGNTLNSDRLETYVKSNKFDAKNLNAHSLGNKDLMRLMMNSNKISLKDLDDLRNKSKANEDAIVASLGLLANDSSYGDIEGDESNKRIQQAYLAQAGKFGDAIKDDAAKKAKMFKSANKETMKRVTEAFVVANHISMTENLDAKNYKSIVTEMNGSAAALLNRAAKDNVSTDGNAVKLKRLAREDSQLKLIG